MKSMQRKLHQMQKKKWKSNTTQKHMKLESKKALKQIISMLVTFLQWDCFHSKFKKTRWLSATDLVLISFFFTRERWWFKAFYSQSSFRSFISVTKSKARRVNCWGVIIDLLYSWHHGLDQKPIHLLKFLKNNCLSNWRLLFVISSLITSQHGERHLSLTPSWVNRNAASWEIIFQTISL